MLLLMVWKMSNKRFELWLFWFLLVLLKLLCFMVLSFLIMFLNFCGLVLDSIEVRFLLFFLKLLVILFCLWILSMLDIMCESVCLFWFENFKFLMKKWEGLFCKLLSSVFLLRVLFFYILKKRFFLSFLRFFGLGVWC